MKSSQLDRADFCRSVNIYVTTDELIECFAAAGVAISKEEADAVMQHNNAHKTGYLLMDDFYAHLKVWKDVAPKGIAGAKGRATSAKRPENRSRFYLKQAKQRAQEEERALALAIDKGKREMEFDCLHKMSEACELAKTLNIPLSFSAYKGGDGALRIHFI